MTPSAPLMESYRVETRPTGMRPRAPRR
jgi:hypothetical protein